MGFAEHEAGKEIKEFRSKRRFHDHRGLDYMHRIVVVSSIIMPLTTLPQIYKIWAFQNATGISLITWTSYAILAIPLLIFSYVHKIKLIFFMNILWLIVYAAVITGTVRYG